MIKFNGKCLLDKVPFESDTSMKDPCITREQSIGIHDVVSDEGFAMHYRAISSTVSHLEVFRCSVRESIQH
jgi:hypothetical protein